MLQACLASVSQNGRTTTQSNKSMFVPSPCPLPRVTSSCIIEQTNNAPGAFGRYFYSAVIILGHLFLPLHCPPAVVGLGPQHWHLLTVLPSPLCPLSLGHRAGLGDAGRVTDHWAAMFPCRTGSLGFHFIEPHATWWGDGSGDSQLQSSE